MRRALLALILLAAALAGAPSNAGAAVPESRVFVVVMENKEYGQIIGNKKAPFTNWLSVAYSSATRMYGIRHPSLPDYLGMLGGSTFGISSNCTSCDNIGGRSFPDQLEDAGISWRAYMEGMPGTCFRGVSSGRYVKRHNPFAYFRDITGDDSCNRVVPASRLDDHMRGGSLAEFNWITPDNCHNTHDCSIKTGDNYLARLVPRLLAHAGPHGFVVVTYDEGSSNAGCCGVANGGRIPTIFAGPDVRRGGKVGRPLTLYSLLRTLEDVFGVAHLKQAGCSCSAPMDDMFIGSRTPWLPAFPPGPVTLGADALSVTNSFDLSWSGPTRVRAPLKKAHLELCVAGGGCTVQTHGLARGQHALAGVQLPGEGRYSATVWLEDAQGDQSPANRSNPVSLVLDQSGPVAALVRGPNDGGRVVRFAVADPISGVDEGSISAEFASPGGDNWQPLAGGSYDESAGTFAAEVPATVGDGKFAVRLRVRDRAGNASELGAAEPLAIVVDTTPPARVELAPDQISSTNAFELTWAQPTNEEEPVARVHVRLCRQADESSCVDTAADAAEGGLSVTVSLAGEGSFAAAAWLEDRYGNADAANISNAASLIFDATPPTGAFEPGRDRDMGLKVADPGDGSGIASCAIEARRRGEAEFEVVAGAGMDESGDRCTGRLPEADFESGPYDLRAIVTDRAGNASTIDRFEDGSPAGTFILHESELRVDAPSSPIRAGASASITAVLSDSRGAIAGADVEVVVRVDVPGAAEQRSTARTGADGRFAIELAPGPNRVVAIRYPGDAEHQPAAQELRVLTEAATSVRRRSTRSIGGRLLGREGDGAGTTVALQARRDGAWRGAGKAATDSSGSWHLRLSQRLASKPVNVRIRIRPAAGYPYVTSLTPAFRLPR